MPHPLDYAHETTNSSLEILRLAESALDTVIPDCPGWVGRNVIRHVGRVYASVTALVVARATEPVDAGSLVVAPEGDDEMLDWFAQRRTEMLDSLYEVEADTPMWTWAIPQNAGFYQRRMTHETAVHVCDLQRGLGIDVEMDRSVAIDGIDEFYGLVLPSSLMRSPRTVPSGSLHLHCTDGDGEWLVVPHGDGITMTREHAKGSVAWRGPAVSLALAAWGRSNTGLEALGDPDVSAEWAAIAP